MNVSRIPIVSMASSNRRSQSSPRNHSNDTLSLRKSALNSCNNAKLSSLSGKVPSPPKRKSSRNSRTLKLYSPASTNSKSTNDNQIRHGQCFLEEQVSNIRLLREKFNHSLEKHRKDREESLKRINRTLSASPISSNRRSVSRLSSDSSKRRSEPCLTRSCDPLLSKSKGRISGSLSPVCRSPLPKKYNELKPIVGKTSSKLVAGLDKVCQHSSRSRTIDPITKKETKVRRTRKEQEESCRRLSRSTVDLTSPTDLQKTLQRQKEKERYPKIVSTKILPSGTIIKNSTAPLASTLGGSRLKLNDKSLKVTVAISPKGREILKKPSETKKSTTRYKSTLSSPNEIKRRKSKDITSLGEKSRTAMAGGKSRSRRELKAPNNTPMRSKQSSKSSSKAGSSERLKTGEPSRSDVVTPLLTIDLLRQHHEATMSDSFFQHLFLRDLLIKSTEPNPLRRSSVLDRARMFQEIGYSDSYKSEPSLKSLNTYLAHKRPVSNSRFRNWERESISSRSSSPCFKSSLSRCNRYDSLIGVDEFSSSSSVRGRSPDLTRECPKERSLSEPPLKTLRESPDSGSHRSPSPSPVRSPASRKIRSLRQEHTNVSDGLKSRATSTSEMNNIANFRQKFGSNLSLTKSTSSLVSFPVDREEYQQYILERLHSRQKSKRYRDLFDFYTSLERMGKLEKTTSSCELRPRLRNEEIIDYELWKQVRVKEKAEQELKDLYRKLQYVQKEKDFVYSTTDVGKYKWRGDCSLRCKERSVESIKEQFCKLANEESDLEAQRQREIAAKKDTYKPLWRGNSVVNVANTMTRKAAEKSDFDRSSVQASLQKSLGGSNKFWSSLSLEQVTALKNQLNDIYGNDTICPKRIGKTKRLKNSEKVSKSSHVSELQKDHLALKAKEVPIVSDSEQSSMSICDYEIIVPQVKREASPVKELGLTVRCHSMIAPDRTKSTDETDKMKRSGSIGRVATLERSQSDRAPKSSSMSEVEKKRLSLTLGQEMLEKVGKKLTSPVKPRETLGAFASSLARSKSSVSPRTCSSIDTELSKNKEKNNHLIVLTPNDSQQREHVKKVMKEWAEKAPIASTVDKEGIDQLDSATESSDTSVRTVVHRTNECEDLQKKVEFYESMEQQALEHKASQKPACKLSYSQSFADLKELFGESSAQAAKYRTVPLARSRSVSPAGKAERITTGSGGGGGGYSSSNDNSSNNKGGRSTSASPDVVASTRQARERDHLPRCPQQLSSFRALSPGTEYSAGSLECLWQLHQQQREDSPDPEKYWRTYLKLVRDGTVRRLRAKFESLEELSHSTRLKIAPVPKRFQSDPELARNLLKKVTDTTKNYIKPQEIPDVAWLRRKYEAPPPCKGRKRGRGGGSPIPRLPWKMEDLTMPHINVISKTAELKDSTAPIRPTSTSRKEETQELEARRAVNRVREMFERSASPKTSILGEMFTSVPDVHELRDIAPYLAGRWVAHQFPSRYDNSRSLSSPPDLSRDTSGSITPPSRKKRQTSSRSSSTSPVRPRTPVSILKQSPQPPPQQDAFANQAFDPSKHRPKFRYQPPPPPLPQPPKVRYRAGTKTWCPPLPTYNARPSVVTFEGLRAKPVNV